MLEVSKSAAAIEYNLNAWTALTLHLDDGALVIDNNLVECQIKAWKLGAKNWLFVGSELAGRRATVVMAETLEQMGILAERKPVIAIVEKGYQGVEIDGVQMLR